MSRLVYTTKQLSERVGHEIVCNALNDIRNTPDEAQRVPILQTALLELQRLPHPKEAAGGFAAVLVALMQFAATSQKSTK